MTFSYKFDPRISFVPANNHKFGKAVGNKILATLRGVSMGGQYMVKAVVDDDTKLGGLNKNIKKTLDIVERQMTIWDDQSTLMKFNKTAPNLWFDLPKETADNFALALEIGNLTNGALDITLGPLVALWGFGPDKRPEQLPSETELNEVAKTIGHQYLEFDRKANKIRKKTNCIISLNAIAKGYGADLVASHLKLQNITNFMIEVAGEIVTSGVKIDGSKWRLAIEKPLVGVSDCQQVVEISNMAIATSGDYRKYFERDGLRYSHIIDTKTMLPIIHKLASVTIIDKRAARADALATAMLVMGEKHAYQFAVDHQIAAFFIIKNDDGFDVTFTSYMAQYLVN